MGTCCSAYKYVYANPRATTYEVAKGIFREHAPAAQRHKAAYFAGLLVLVETGAKRMAKIMEMGRVIPLPLVTALRNEFGDRLEFRLDHEHRDDPKGDGRVNADECEQTDTLIIGQLGGIARADQMLGILKSATRGVNGRYASPAHKWAEQVAFGMFMGYLDVLPASDEPSHHLIWLISDGGPPQILFSECVRPTISARAIDDRLDAIRSALEPAQIQLEIAYSHEDLRRAFAAYSR